MVRALERGLSMQKSKSFHIKRMFEIPGQQVHSLNLSKRSTDAENGDEHKMAFRSQGSRIPDDKPLEIQKIGCALTRNDNSPVSRLDDNGAKIGTPSDNELMKERFAKLLLGEDMSGGGKGVSSALAISNAITNLAASIFGEKSRLEPMSPERKARWRKEIDWLLSIADHIVEFVPSQTSSNGTNLEIMVTRQRNDLLDNIPALRKLDAMLLGHLDNFGDGNEFWYVSRDADEAENGDIQRKDDKWWLPTVKVPPNGLSDMSRKWLHFQKDSVNQVLKLAMAINAQVLAEMEIPENYIESLPKNGRASLGDSIYKSITVEYFDPEQFLSTMDLSTEHKVLDLKNRIEASIVIWERKMHNKDGKSSWGSAVSLEKRELFEERAETILLLLKQQFPGLPQSSLDICKIQYNRDVGQSILESYSRVIESLAFTVMSRIEDVLYADAMATSVTESNEEPVMDSSPSAGPGEETDTPNSKTLSDFMGWNVNQEENNMYKKYPIDNMEMSLKGENEKMSFKPTSLVTTKIKTSYLEKLENLGLRSPRARH
ncbi:PRONE domain-containing protein, partial [Cephalotus follicularis]